MTVITISRGSLSGAELLAENVANELGIPCITREMILDLAREAGAMADALLEQVDRPPSFFNRHSRERESYLLQIRSTLCQQACEGSFVYQGHGGNLLLAGLPQLIRVHVCASIDFRAKHVMESQNMDRTAAEKYIRRMDQQRAKWTRYLYEVDWQDPSLYDLTINVEQLSLDDACKVVALIARQPKFQSSDETAGRIDDIALAARATAELAKSGDLFRGNLEVGVRDGAVTVSGRVRSPRLAEELQDTIRTVLGDELVQFELETSAENIHWGFG